MIVPIFCCLCLMCVIYSPFSASSWELLIPSVVSIMKYFMQSTDSSSYLSTDYLNLNNSLFYNEYIVVVTFLFVAIVLSVVILLFSYILAVQKPETEKLSTYECGFEPYEDARHTFDVKFYLVAILFIVFDIETMFLIPWTSVLSQLDLVGFWSMIDFIFELGIGYLYIYCIGALDIH